MTVKVEWVGMDSLVKMLARAGSEAPRVLGRALDEEAQIILADSQALVPFDEGTLSASGQVHPPSMDAGSVVVEISYGGNARDYAAAQHENLDYRHDPGRSAKYLERPFDAALPGMDGKIAARVQAILDGRI